MIKGLEHLSYKERQKMLRPFILKKKCPRGDLFNVYKYLMGGIKKMKPDFSPRDPMTRQDGTN